MSIEKTASAHDALGTSSRQRHALAAALLDVHGVENRYGISVRMLRRLVAERRIPFVKVGKHVRFRPEHIEAWLDDNTVQAVNGTRAR